jgi:hypothetical protein
MAAKTQPDEFDDFLSSSDDSTHSIDSSNASGDFNQHFERKTLKFSDPLKDMTFKIDVSRFFGLWWVQKFSFTFFNHIGKFSDGV